MNHLNALLEKLKLKVHTKNEGKVCHLCNYKVKKLIRKKVCENETEIRR